MTQTIKNVTVTDVKQWTKTLFSFKVVRPLEFKFTAGQFVRLGLNVNQIKRLNAQHDDTETIFRAYSVVSSPYDEFIEFFSVVIPDGVFTSKLQYLQVGDTLQLDTTPYGFLTLSRYQAPAPKDLWLLATGTGVAPFLSILKTLDVWQTYQKIYLIYSARTQQELAYLEEIAQLQATYGENGADFQFIPIVTREADFDGLKQRLPTLILSGELENCVKTNLNPKSSHVMLCGNPQMVDDTKEALKQKGLTMNRRSEGNIAVENYW
ncbi:oxidoreductase FAD/NAD(P)-binding subunit [Moraxella macacae 0408225]|uniref:ferredoxin--NADP(+) reductase n=1 Tax=Moraxella macacae 0408225 TaxID=1230338 RepID=L2F790_9GAMM|nr:ferredoxin--NADP reductase [Moraxella macacae]ELA08770.1 oxidoreductase FAD/NAD(P)-binding subunit [Moraxella macacae 0408225]